MASLSHLVSALPLLNDTAATLSLEGGGGRDTILLDSRLTPPRRPQASLVWWKVLLGRQPAAFPAVLSGTPVDPFLFFPVSTDGPFLSVPDEDPRGWGGPVPGVSFLLLRPEVQAAGRWEGVWCPPPTPSLSRLPWQVCDPRSEVLHGQHSPHTDPVQKCAGEVRTTKAPGTWRGGEAGGPAQWGLPPATEPSPFGISSDFLIL